MNCKQGDLAIHVKGPHTGKIVTCVKYVGHGKIYANEDTLEACFADLGAHGNGHVWEVTPALHLVHPDLGPMTSRLQYDRVLKPLDADLLDDEVVDNKELENV